MSHTPAKIQQIIRNLEGVLKTSANEEQRRRVYKDIQKWKKELNRVANESPSGFEKADNPVFTSFGSESQGIKSYEFLKHIHIEPLNENVANKEVNEIYSFLKHIEEEYIGVLSEYHLKTDFSHALTRDSFYILIHDCFLALRSYGEVFDKMDDENLPDEYRSRLKMTSQAEYRNIVTKVGVFLRKLYFFIDELVEDYGNNGHLLNNATSKLQFDRADTKKHILEGCTVIEGVQDLHRFLFELLDYLNLPEIKIKN